MEVQVLTTTKGKPMLCIENYLYVKNKNLVNQIRWDCLKKRTDLRCQAYVKTTLNYGDPEFVSDHCYPSNETEVNRVFRHDVII